MTHGLTARQTQVLNCLIDEYVETAEPIGSEVLEKKHNLGVSSATIRNEMVALTKLGYLRQPHTSAGRVPSPRAMKFYIDQLMEEKHMSLADEVKAKEEVWDARGNINSLFSETVQALAQRTDNLAVAVINEDEKMWHSGYSNVFTNPEFADLALCADLFSLIEESSKMHELFFERIHDTPDVQVVFFEELGWPTMEPVGVVGTQMNIRGKSAALGVISPVRLSPTIIPILRYFSSMIQEVARG